MLKECGEKTKHVGTGKTCDNCRWRMVSLDEAPCVVCEESYSRWELPFTTERQETPVVAKDLLELTEKAMKTLDEKVADIEKQLGHLDSAVLRFEDLARGLYDHESRIRELREKVDGLPDKDLVLSARDRMNALSISVADLKKQDGHMDSVALRLESVEKDQFTFGQKLKLIGENLVKLQDDFYGAKKPERLSKVYVVTAWDSSAAVWEQEVYVSEEAAKKAQERFMGLKGLYKIHLKRQEVKWEGVP